MNKVWVVTREVDYEGGSVVAVFDTEVEANVFADSTPTQGGYYEVEGFMVTSHECPTEKQKREYLREHGWNTWYSDNLWVHRKLVMDEKRQDYTRYGLRLNQAYIFEQDNHPPFRSLLDAGRI